MNRQDDRILTSLLSGKTAKKYEGKQVIIIGGEVYILPKDDKKSKEILNRLISKHPKATPTITFVPKHGACILPNTSWPPTLFRAF